MTTEPGDALVVNVAGLLGEPPGSQREIVAEGVLLDLGEDLRQAESLTLRARLGRTNRGIVVKGSVRTALADTCGRCLAPMQVPIEATFDEEVLPAVELQTGLPVDTSTEPEAYRLSDHHELDLEPIAREAVQLAAPIVPVCRPDCAGLCAACGRDLNDDPHDHGDGPVDPRLARLADFRADG